MARKQKPKLTPKERAEAVKRGAVKRMLAQTEYQPEYCEMLIQHCTEGKSIKSFAGAVGVTIKTIYTWFKNFPEFAEAKERAEAASLNFWEEIGIMGMVGRVPDFNPTTWIFNMKNRFREDWSDAKKVEISGGLNMLEADLTQDQRDQFVNDSLLDMQDLTTDVIEHVN